MSLVLEKYSSLILKSFFYGSFEQGASINKPSLFCGLNYKYWEARIKIFVESIDQRIWDAIENDPFIFKIKKGGSFTKKPWSQWTNEESEKAKFDCIAILKNFSGSQNVNLLRRCGIHLKQLMRVSLK